MSKPSRSSSVRVVSVQMADGSDPYSPENLARIQRALLSAPRITTRHDPAANARLRALLFPEHMSSADEGAQMTTNDYTRSTGRR